MRNSPSVALFLVLMLLLHQPVAALNWQGTGNFTNDNLTIIWNYIQNNLASSANGGTLQQFTTQLSETLNTNWDRGWNVVTTKFLSTTSIYNDVVVYGYAYNNHWMWFNNYVDQAVSSKAFSFVIWKDYNCASWKNLGFSADTADLASGFTSGQKTDIMMYIFSITTDSMKYDPWGVAKTLLDKVQASSNFVSGNDRAYSIVLQQ